jgi:hypothetical protein
VMIGVLRALHDLEEGGRSLISFDSSFVFVDSSSVKLFPTVGTTPAIKGLGSLRLEPRAAEWPLFPESVGLSRVKAF